MGPPSVRFDSGGLVPAVVQDAVSGDVLMLAYMNDEALRLTQQTGRTHFWSRSRGSLWRKGETSGHEQIVDEIRVNCEQNSLLLLVRQVEAVCHAGYPTCFYRRANPDGSLTVVRDRAFDPSEVYSGLSPASQPGEPGEIDALAEATRRQFGAYAYLRDHDLTDESSTSRCLRDHSQDFRSRIAAELLELAGVLDGSHRHSDRERDLLLESSQVIYWTLLQALRDGLTWSRLRPDRALTTGEEQIPVSTVTQLLRAQGSRWSVLEQPDADIAASLHATIALVGQACASAGLSPLAVVEIDLDDLNSRPYLAPFFHQTVDRLSSHGQDGVQDELSD
ncbi:MAG: phosphoribosyl-AMP cyclohydrolase [Chloroflexi bacterium]|nr:phosphoribosyl-AMP cyclohydrolase [Chloroflexota bacterium]